MADIVEAEDLIVITRTREYMDDQYGYDGVMDIGMLSFIVGVDGHEFYVTGDGAHSDGEADDLCVWMHNSYVKRLRVKS